MKTALRLTVAAFGLAISNLSAATLFVSLESTNPKAPFATWETAATNIQDAVDAAAAADEVVVTNGVYATGGRAVETNILVNRVAVEKPLTLRSVNGPQFTVIQGAKVPGSESGCGDEAVRCVCLADRASLSGFTLANGATREVWAAPDGEGGGVRCASTNVTLTNCVIIDNSALSDGGGVYGGTLHNCTLTGNSASLDASGGGAVSCTLYNCTLTGNSAGSYAGGALNSILYNCTLTDNSIYGGSDAYGGGAVDSTLYNCVLTGNGAGRGGGAAYCTLYNCTLTGNSAESFGGVMDCTLYNSIVYYHYSVWDGTPDNGSGVFKYSCTTPLPGGPGNIDAEPRFVSAVAGDFRLRSDSPCIDAGTDLGALFTNDIDGTLRPSDGNGDGVAAFDMGAYESRLRPLSSTTLYVSLDSPNPTWPYTNWATAAHVIQEAVDAAAAGADVLVTNGVYFALPRVFTQVVVDKPMTVRSVNGPQFTVITGAGAMRCAYLYGGASLSGFTLTSGRAATGGGVYATSRDATVTNCVLTGNSANGGGGAAGCTLYNCTLTNNVTF